MDEITVVVGTYGSPVWERLAKRAIHSAEHQAPTIHVHLPKGTLAEARNAGLDQVETEFVVHLDADDELEVGYVEAMQTGTADLRAPAVRYVRHRVERAPYFPHVWNHAHDCSGECLRQGNWIVVGACVRTEIARAHGWEEFGWSEDWAMWARCWKAGATIERIPEAIYRAHKEGRGRNKVKRDVSARWHREIEAAVWPEEVA